MWWVLYVYIRVRECWTMESSQPPRGLGELDFHEAFQAEDYESAGRIAEEIVFRRVPAGESRYVVLAARVDVP